MLIAGLNLPIFTLVEEQTAVCSSASDWLG
jgi:hypothetical protein